MPAAPLFWSELHSPIGPLLLVASHRGLRQLRFPEDGALAAREPSWLRDDARLAPVRRQLRAYFAAELRRFALALDPVGTPFQQSVWELLASIPWGETTSYGALAARLGRPGAARAVGAANGANPLPIVLPCHRVIGADGSLTGFGGGLAAKRWLLRHEGCGQVEQTRLF
jgi:methylated-DNA-[protein]-cysteine S-methyltransferase